MLPSFILACYVQSDRTHFGTEAVCHLGVALTSCTANALKVSSHILLYLRVFTSETVNQPGLKMQILYRTNPLIVRELR
jgi:hypothetical protein